MSRGAGFMRDGFDDLEARLASVLPLPIADHPVVIRTVQFSAIGRGLTHTLSSSRAAFASSVTGGWARRALSSWAGAHWSSRRRSAGLLLLVAAIVHLALVGSSSTGRGWLWMVIPVLAAMVGVLSIAASFSPAGRDSR